MQSAVVTSDQAIRGALARAAARAGVGQELEAPRHHPFPARMPLPLAKHILSSMTTQRAVILDPMVGSGTTMIAARALDRSALGFDRDPLACLIARTSTSEYPRDALESLRERIFARASAGFADLKLDRARADLGQEERQFIRYWFPRGSQKQLLALRNAIAAERDASLRDFALVVLSSLIIAKSAGASYAMDISRSRPHKRSDKSVIEPFTAWDRRFRQAIERQQSVSAAGVAAVSIQHGDARALPLDDETVDFVLTSPPYLNAIDYLRAHKFSLVWMGHDLESLRELRGTMIGTERGLHVLDGLPTTIEDRITNRLRETRHQARVRRYLSDFGKMLAELNRVLRPNGAGVLVVGPTLINAIKTDAVALVSKIAQHHGLRTVGSAARLINATRRSLPPPAMFGKDASLGSRMRREVLIALRKDE